MTFTDQIWLSNRLSKCAGLQRRFWGLHASLVSHNQLCCQTDLLENQVQSFQNRMLFKNRYGAFFPDFDNCSHFTCVISIRWYVSWTSWFKKIHFKPNGSALESRNCEILQILRICSSWFSRKQGLWHF